ncbi:hypothetical protein DL767_006684 [Monosporascus sp. MG133]|nr:hypothetical protein DL767_006684 [Monosporascus sp. MG133]
MVSEDSSHHSNSSPAPQLPSRSQPPKEKSRLGRPTKEMVRRRIEAGKRRNPTRGIQQTVGVTPSHQHDNDVPKGRILTAAVDARGKEEKQEQAAEIDGEWEKDDDRFFNLQMEDTDPTRAPMRHSYYSLMYCSISTNP